MRKGKLTLALMLGSALFLLFNSSAEAHRYWYYRGPVVAPYVAPPVVYQPAPVVVYRPSYYAPYYAPGVGVAAPGVRVGVGPGVSVRAPGVSVNVGGYGGYYGGYWGW